MYFKTIMACSSLPNWLKNVDNVFAPSAAFLISLGVILLRYLRYLQVKDDYCISYYGLLNEFIYQLLYIRPAIEHEFPRINLYIGCKEEIKDKVKEERLISLSELKTRDFVFKRNLSFDNDEHPVLKFLEESNISLKFLTSSICQEATKKCIILTKSIPPFKPLIDQQINAAKQKAIQSGLEVELDGDVKNAGLVIGCECEKLYEAVFLGIKTCLIPTNFGTKLFQMLCPNNEIFKC